MAPTEGRVARPDGGGAAAAVPPVHSGTQQQWTHFLKLSPVSFTGKANL